MRKQVEHLLSDYNRLAVWGAGSAAAQAVREWLPKDKIVCLVESDADNTGKTRFGYNIQPPSALEEMAIDCIVVCTDSYNEILQEMALSESTTPVIHIYDLLCGDDEGKNELSRLVIDIRVQKHKNWVEFLLDRPQILVNVTYRLTRACSGIALLLPVYYLLRFLHTIVSVYFSISLPPTVKAGAGLVFQHFGSIVLHPNTRLGRFARIYQGATIGANDKGEVPVIKDFVTIYHGAAVLGKCVIGSHARVGAMALAINLTSDCPCTIYGQPARVQRVFETPRSLQHQS
jgi:serine acetyltransferase